LNPWFLGSRVSRYQGLWVPFFLDNLASSPAGPLVSRSLVSSVSRFLYAKFSMSQAAALPILQACESPHSHRYQSGKAALVPRIHDTPFPRYVVPLFSGFPVTEKSKFSRSQVTGSRWIAVCRHPTWNQVLQVPSSFGFWSTTVCRHLAHRGLSAIKAAGTACSFSSLGFEVSRQCACHGGCSSLNAQTTRIQGLKLTHRTCWPGRHASSSTWTQGAKQVQLAWVFGAAWSHRQLGIKESSHPELYGAKLRRFLGSL